MHTHQSIWKNGKNSSTSAAGTRTSRKMCLYYIGGILKHAPALLAFIAPSTNSYKRLVPGYGRHQPRVQPAEPLGGHSHPHVLKKEGAKRSEFRTPDPTCNPYLSFARHA